MIIAIVFLLPGATGTVYGQWHIEKSEFIFQEGQVPFKQCHASTIVQLGDGSLAAAWFGGAFEGSADVEVWMSYYKAGSWSVPVSVANGRGVPDEHFPCWNPVLFRDRHGMLHLYYKVGPNPREWWGMEKVSGDDGHCWSSAIRLPTGVLGPIKNKPVQLANGVILSPSSTEDGDDRWRVHIERSEDDGKNWTIIPVDHSASGFNVIQPSILQYADGHLQLLCRSKEGTVVQAWSSDEGRSWSMLSKSKLINPNSGIDAVTLKDGKQLIVYNPDVPGKEWYNGRAKLRVAISVDGLDWEDVAVLEDGHEEEFSYPAVIQAKNGEIHITYTYDRKMIKHVVIK